VTSADEFVLQLLTDKGLLEESTIETARAKVNESDYDGSEDTAALEALVADQSITQQQIADVLAEEFNMETVNLADVRVSAEALEVVPYELANRYKVIPLEVDDSEAELAVFDPLDEQLRPLHHGMPFEGGTARAVRRRACGRDRQRRQRRRGGGRELAVVPALQRAPA
jgi:hypothetical protein